MRRIRLLKHAPRKLGRVISLTNRRNFLAAVEVGDGPRGPAVTMRAEICQVVSAVAMLARDPLDKLGHALSVQRGAAYWALVAAMPVRVTRTSAGWMTYR